MKNFHYIDLAKTIILTNTVVPLAGDLVNGTV